MLVGGRGKPDVSRGGGTGNRESYLNWGKPLARRLLCKVPSV